MKNKEISQLMDKMGDLLEFKGENVFRVNAYRKAARTLDQLTEDIEKIEAEGRLRQIPGIGEGITKDIRDYLATGAIERYETEKKGIPDSALEMMNIPGFGPKSASHAFKELGIKSIDELEAAIKAGALRELSGFGAKKEENILRGIQLLREGSTRMLLGLAFDKVEAILEYMKPLKSIHRIEPAGSFRRRKETVGDIDILVTTDKPKEVIKHFTQYPGTLDILGAGDTKSSIRIEGNFQVDLRVVEEEAYGAALQYFTGSKEHNVKIREIARQKGLKVNEYGVFKGEEKIAGKDEAEVYKSLGLHWIPPELREDTGEIDLAREGKLPALVEFKHLKGDIHCHSNWSDGKHTIEELAECARKMGYEYLAITDHSGHLKIAGGLSESDLYDEMMEIKELNKKYSQFTLLTGNEVDILSDGKMDYSDEVLKELDIVIGSLHMGSKKDLKSNTDRVIAAIYNPYVTTIGHLTGRLIGDRDPFPLDIDAIFRAAAETGTAMEINTSYQRMDLKDIHARKAHEMGIILSMGTDTHSIESFKNIRLGIAIARRAGIPPEGILNTWAWEKILKFKQAKLKKLKG
jgi:DNA polymerase (family 10)